MIVRTGFHNIGDGQPVYTVAEIGLNHNGSEELAGRCIQAAKNAGASAAKFQLYDSRFFINDHAALGDEGPGSLQRFFKQFELSRESWRSLARFCRGLEIDFVCSVFDLPSLEFYLTLDPALIKLASCDINNRMLLEAAGATGLPILLATGTASENEVEAALGWLGKSNVVLLQCVSSYPARPSDYNLNVLIGWRNHHQSLVGLSDHTPDHLTAQLSIALGACVVEKHFTIDRSLPGPDHSISLIPNEFEELVKLLVDVQAVLGDGVKRCTAAERPALLGGRRGLYAARLIRAGQKITEADVLAQRPAGGLEAGRYEQLLGRQARAEIRQGTLLDESLFTL